MLKRLSKLIHIITDIVFPARCAGCQTIGAIVCDRCVQTLEPLPTQVAIGVTSIFSYQHRIIKQLLWALKYKSDKSIATFLAPYLADVLVDQHAEESLLNIRNEPLIIVPVPISNSRKRKRGFNQAEVLALELVNLYPDSFICLPNVVRKIKNTKAQVECRSRAERLQNVVGTFEANVLENFYQRHFIILDDVTTTGTTLTEVQKVLTKAGAKNVSAVTVAHG